MKNDEIKVKIFKACGLIFMICGAGFLALYITIMQQESVPVAIAIGYIIFPLAAILYGLFMFRRSQKIRRELNEQKLKEGN